MITIRLGKDYSINVVLFILNIIYSVVCFVLIFINLFIE